jgi:hypothetical protein
MYKGFRRRAREFISTPSAHRHDRPLMCNGIIDESTGTVDFTIDQRTTVRNDDFAIVTVTFRGHKYARHKSSPKFV